MNKEILTTTWLSDYIEATKKKRRLSKGEALELFEIYKLITNRKETNTGCSACVRRCFDGIIKHFNQLKKEEELVIELVELPIIDLVDEQPLYTPIIINEVKTTKKSKGSKK